jgi:hypothetical protein
MPEDLLKLPFHLLDVWLEEILNQLNARRLRG